MRGTQDIGLTERQAQALDVELNKHGFYGMSNRPVLRNVYDSKRDRLAKLTREKKAFDKQGEIFDQA